MKQTFLILLMVAGMAATAQTFEERIFIATDAMVSKRVEKDGAVFTAGKYDHSETNMRLLIGFEIEKMGLKPATAWKEVDGAQRIEVNFGKLTYFIVMYPDDKILIVTYF